MTQKFKEIDNEQIMTYIKAGILKEEQAVKDVPVKAIEITNEMLDEINKSGGYTTIVRSPENGELVKETTNKNLNVGDFLVTNQINGYDNSYVVSAEKFKKLYNPTEENNIFEPKEDIKKVYQVAENVKFEAPWGEKIDLYKGGYIVAENNTPDNNQFYGINKEEFDATYSIIKNEKIDRGSKPAVSKPKK